MHLLQFIILLLMAFFLCLNASMENYTSMEYDPPDDMIKHTIIVDKEGRGNFITIQAAVDSVPSHNRVWIRIFVNAGIYREQVTIPEEKQFVLLEARSSRTTKIEYWAAGDSQNSATLRIHADNFAARNITVRNSYNLIIPSLNDTRMTWAPALLVTSDKVSFSYCYLTSLQDTVADYKGRHHYRNCFIEGAVDFIWGGGQSVFQTCAINILGDAIGGPGYITAQGRANRDDPGGFVFRFAMVIGKGQAYLGRPYTAFARVIFYKSWFSNVVVPEGWSQWQQGSHLDTVTFVEALCRGDGMDKGKRVPWLKTLSPQDLYFFASSVDFIDKDRWIEKIPLS